MDAVITYVDGNDPAWKRDYERYTHVPVMEKRYRDWGTLKYLLRGIETCMPFVRNVYLVVSHESQVPQWADTANLKIVLHRDIIPEEYLPTFNSTAIEMFLHKIEGLNEQFIYFNDDMFPVRTCTEEDFFRDGKARLGMTNHLFASGLYKIQCRNSDRLARKALGLSPSCLFVRPQHICSPMLRSECENAFRAVTDEVLTSISRLREPKNLNQYFYLDYMYHGGKLVAEKISNKHFSTAVASAEKISAFIMEPYRTFCCINDVRMSEEKFNNMRKAIVEAFEVRFPLKSVFEL
ncbi:MAG: hypothetical protein IJV84_03260 [Bacteroidales bacterium]|nr:hypothetical protein [Bacteroidales bacterium]